MLKATIVGDVWLIVANDSVIMMTGRFLESGGFELKRSHDLYYRQHVGLIEHTQVIQRQLMTMPEPVRVRMLTDYVYRWLLPAEAQLN